MKNIPLNLAIFFTHLTFQTPFEVVRKIVGQGMDKTWTGDGYLKVKRGSVIDFTELRVPQTGDYNLVLRYDTLVSIQPFTYNFRPS